MSRLPNGMIVFMAESMFPGPKMLDIEVTNTFPLISLGGHAFLLRPGQPALNISQYDHVAIPPDLKLHISGPDHIFFNAEPLWSVANGSALAHCFSFAGRTYSRAAQIVAPGKTKTWHQAAIISPIHDDKFGPMTRLFVDFFIHDLPEDWSHILGFPIVFPGGRLASDRSGSILGPFDFDSLQRKQKLYDGKLGFSIRFGYVEMENNDATYLYTALDIFHRRPRSL